MLNCHQGLASDACFSLAMLAEFEKPVSEDPWRYRQLHWEAGLLGHVLYLEAEALGLRGTGIGCFFDDALHEAIGLRDARFAIPLSLHRRTCGARRAHPDLSALSQRHNRARTKMTEPVAQERMAQTHFELIGGTGHRRRYRRCVLSPHGHGCPRRAPSARCIHPTCATRRGCSRNTLPNGWAGHGCIRRSAAIQGCECATCPFRIGVAERDAWMLCMRGAMEEMVAAEALRETLLQQLFKTADWMRNSDVSA